MVCSIFKADTIIILKRLLTRIHGQCVNSRSLNFSVKVKNTNLSYKLVSCVGLCILIGNAFQQYSLCQLASKKVRKTLEINDRKAILYLNRLDKILKFNDTITIEYCKMFKLYRTRHRH